MFQTDILLPSPQFSSLCFNHVCVCVCLCHGCFTRHSHVEFWEKLHLSAPTFSHMKVKPAGCPATDVSEGLVCLNKETWNARLSASSSCHPSTTSSSVETWLTVTLDLHMMSDWQVWKGWVTDRWGLMAASQTVLFDLNLTNRFTTASGGSHVWITRWNRSESNFKEIMLFCLSVSEKKKFIFLNWSVLIHVRISLIGESLTEDNVRI